jgi:hypothetical protein
MFVTSKFVFLHQPKTGGTFVTAILTKLHEARGERVETVYVEPGQEPALPDLASGGAAKIMVAGRHQHGRRADIPRALRDRTVVATMRNPYDRYPSQYEFAWWRRFPEMFGPVEEVTRRHPRYPELTFDEFVRLTNDVSVPADPARPAEGLGFHTYQFVEAFARHPERTWRALCEDPEGRAWTADTDGVIFLDQTHLNNELQAFLIDTGYDTDEVAFVADAARIWPPEGGRITDPDWTKYYTPELKAYIRRQERLLFERFPQFDV